MRSYAGIYAAWVASISIGVLSACTSEHSASNRSDDTVASATSQHDGNAAEETTSDDESAENVTTIEIEVGGSRGPLILSQTDGPSPGVLVQDGRGPGLRTAMSSVLAPVMQPFTLHGRALDERSGAPITQFNLAILPGAPDPSFLRQSITRDKDDETQHHRLHRDQLRLFRNADGNYSVEDITARVVTIFVQAVGYGLQRFEYRPPIGQPRVEHDIRLQTEPLITGRLIDSQGWPVVGAKVLMEATPEPMLVSSMYATVGDAVAVTDDQGRFGLHARLHPFTPITFSHLNYAPTTVVVGEEESRVAATMFRAGRVEGTVFVDGRPAKDSVVSVERQTDIYSDLPRQAAEVVVNATGRYQFANLPPGVYDLNFTGDLANGLDTISTKRAVVVSEGQSTTANFDL